MPNSVRSQEPYHQKILFPEQQGVNLSRIERDLTQEWRVNHHFHDICEMVVYEAIEGEMFCGGESRTIGRGQVVFVPPDTIHSFVVQPGHQIYHVLHFEASKVSRINPDFLLPEGALLADATAQDFECLLGLLRWCQSLEESGGEEHCPTTLNGALDLILCLFFEKIAASGISSGVANAGAFAPLVKYLNAHHRYQLSVEQAAELCHLSRSHFMSKFKKTYGVTFNQFMVQRKIDAAKYLLRSSSLSVTEIAHRLEMDSASYFTKVFKNEVGCTPKAYASREKK
ncbi:AraC family transcriptional regulator [Pseudomaricurvus alkylphenolicus]|uniref:helix-turn-helix transcriptional regulator n=1 Tax=Pseudomaricurvus alkylphenolicus TaxID=1306991 RepID=UPI00141F1084|nr:AraC family transcriptional regulator [Pseudomaricurvus alkylphenolicus]NIB41631.1 AraC family transcriptional regulator [Pseudomaricurvus alkylphenolicus]